jgi:TRAP transporter TAXI family solute receptor
VFSVWNQAQPDDTELRQHFTKFADPNNHVPEYLCPCSRWDTIPCQMDRLTMLKREKIAARIRNASLRDIATVAILAMLIIAFGFMGAAQFVRPAPPKRLVLATGEPGGAYQRYAAAYSQALERHGIELVERPSTGSIENAGLLRDRSQSVDAAFIQGGTTELLEDDGLTSLGALYYEPLWVFYRDGVTKGAGLDYIAQLKGRRIAVGNAGTGNRQLAIDVLHANNMDDEDARLVDLGGFEAAEALISGKVDAALVVGPTQSSAVWVLLYTPGIRVMSLSNAETYVRMFPYLSAVTLPEGSIDLVKNIPDREITMVAPMATLAVRRDTHPAHIDLLLEAAREVHGRPDIFNRPGEFPKAQGVGFPLAPEAERYYKSGKPFLQRYLPFWAATLIDRLVVMLIPLFAILIPVVRFAPAVYGWRVRSRIYRRYGELKFLEADVESDPGQHTREEWLKKLDVIESGINRIPIPLHFFDMLYTLRSHLALVRETILKRTAA